MLKKYLVVFIMVAAFLLAGASCVTATPISLTEEEEAAMANEPALTQAEIDLFITFGPEMVAAGQSPEEDAMDKVSQKAGWSRIRTAYVGSKIGLGYSLIIDPEGTRSIVDTGLIPPNYLPTENEQELIKQNFEALDKMIQSTK